MDLSSSGESDFFSTGSSGWGGLKSSSRKVIWRTMHRSLVKDEKNVNITEMFVDIHLFGIKGSNSMRGYMPSDKGQSGAYSYSRI